MAIHTKIEFDNPINSSLQIGDEVFVSTVLTGGITSEPVFAALVTSISPDNITIGKDNATSPIISNGDFILFAKDIRVNESSLKGYYADVTFENFSNTKTELYAISSEVTPSSK